MPLRLLTAWCAEKVLTGVGIAVERVGTRLQGEGFNLDVAEPCSGVRSMVALVAVTIVMAVRLPVTSAQRLALVFLAIAVAFLGNLFRVFAIAIVAASRGQADATGVFHDWSAYVVFMLEVLLMMRVADVHRPQASS